MQFLYNRKLIWSKPDNKFYSESVNWYWLESRVWLFFVWRYGLVKSHSTLISFQLFDVVVGSDSFQCVSCQQLNASFSCLICQYFCIIDCYCIYLLLLPWHHETKILFVSTVIVFYVTAAILNVAIFAVVDSWVYFNPYWKWHS